MSMWNDGTMNDTLAEVKESIGIERANKKPMMSVNKFDDKVNA